MFAFDEDADGMSERTVRPLTTRGLESVSGVGRIDEKGVAAQVSLAGGCMILQYSTLKVGESSGRIFRRS